MVDNNELVPIESGRAIELAVDQGFEIDHYSPEQVQRLLDISEGVACVIVGSPDNAQSQPTQRHRIAALVTTIAVAEQFPRLVTDSGSVRVDNDIQSDDAELLETIGELVRAEVTDVRQFLAERNPILFDETDDVTSDLVGSLKSILAIAREYQSQISELDEDDDNDDDEFQEDQQLDNEDDENDEDEDESDENQVTIVDGSQF